MMANPKASAMLSRGFPASEKLHTDRQPISTRRPVPMTSPMMAQILSKADNPMPEVEKEECTVSINWRRVSGWVGAI